MIRHFGENQLWKFWPSSGRFVKLKYQYANSRIKLIFVWLSSLHRQCHRSNGCVSRLFELIVRNCDKNRTNKELISPVESHGFEFRNRSRALESNVMRPRWQALQFVKSNDKSLWTVNFNRVRCYGRMRLTSYYREQKMKWCAKRCIYVLQKF